MRRLIVSDQLTWVRRMLKQGNQEVRFVVLTDSASDDRIRSYLKARPGTEETSQGAWALQHREAFRTAYIEFMADLNQQHDTFLWKAMPFTNKNPFSTTLCQDLCAFLMIVEMTERHPGTLVVVTHSRELANQLKRWGRRQGIPVARAVRGQRPFHRLLATYTPAAIVYAFAKSLVVWCLARRPPAQTPTAEGRGPVGGIDVVTTAFPPSSVGPQGWREAYFGPLIGSLSRAGRQVMIFAIFFERSIATLRAMQRLKTAIAVVPVEACLSLGDLIRCLIDALGWWADSPRLHGTARINGLDVSDLVRGAIRDSCRSTSLFVHFLIHRGAFRLAQQLTPQRWFYPYENRSWEKMVLTAVRKASPSTRCIGYQHATITPSHFNLFLGRGESLVTPLPDTILTVGEVVHNQLLQLGNYPHGLLRLGCALRQHQTMTNGLARRRPARIARVLVPLATSAQEYRQVYAFLRAAFARPGGYEVRIRPHPEFTLEEILGHLAAPQDRFYTVSRGTLSDDLAWADVVVYASSTVSVEALSLGIPIVCLEFGEVLGTDPLSEWHDPSTRPAGAGLARDVAPQERTQGAPGLHGRLHTLKWTVTQPSELIETFGRITAVPEGQFAVWQEQAQEYARRYLRPVTEERLKAFLEV